jgi:hypothetical protein
MYENLFGNSVGRIEWIFLTVHTRAILKIVKSMCNGIKKSNARCNDLNTLLFPPNI